MNDRELLDNVLECLEMGALRPAGINAGLCGRVADVVRKGRLDEANLLLRCTPRAVVWYISGTGTCSARPPVDTTRIDEDSGCGTGYGGWIVDDDGWDGDYIDDIEE